MAHEHVLRQRVLPAERRQRTLGKDPGQLGKVLELSELRQRTH